MGGVYSLIVPDKRYMFDCYRQLTTVKDCINNYENTATNHSKGSNVDYFLNIVKNNNQIAWTKMDACRDVSIVHGNIDAKESLGNNGYLDIHESVFTPKSFELLIRDLNELGYIDLTIKEIKEATCLGEFYVTLQKSTKKVITNNEQRIEMLKQIMEEQLFARESEMVSRYINRIIKTKEELQLKENVGCVKNFCIDYSNVWITSTNSSLQDEDLILCGWLIMNNNFEADKIYFKIGEKYFLGQLEERSDVANVFKLNNAKCGFRMCIPHKLISLKSLDLVELIAVNNEKNYFQLAIDASQIVTGTQK